MKTYKVEFSGKTKGAIGYDCEIICLVEGENEDTARVNLYKNFDHILINRITELQNYNEVIEATKLIKGDYLIRIPSFFDSPPYEIGYYRKEVPK